MLHFIYMFNLFEKFSINQISIEYLWLIYENNHVVYITQIFFSFTEN